MYFKIDVNHIIESGRLMVRKSQWHSRLLFGVITYICQHVIYNFCFLKNMGVC